MGRVARTLSSPNTMFSPERSLPFKSHLLSIDGHKMHVIDEGSGPVVVCLHGNPTWSYFYRSVIEGLRDRFRVIAPDHIGCGLSDHPETAHFRAKDRVRHLELLLDELKVEKFSLVMHDWGGPIGTFFAVQHPERIERIVYLNTTLTETFSLPLIIKTAAKPLIGKLITKQTKQFLNFLTELGAAKKLTDEVKAGYYYPYQTPERRTAIWDFVSDIPFDTSHPTYPYLLVLADNFHKLHDIPVQIIWGLKDPCFHKGMLSKVAQHFPKARVLELPNASHLVLEDAPEIAVPLIRNFFLEETPKGPAAVKAISAENSLYTSFRDSAKKFGNDPAVIIPRAFGGALRYEQRSFRELLQKVNRYERGLSELGLRQGDRVLMLVPPGEEFLALSFAVMGRGAVPMYVDPGVGMDNLLKCISDAAPDVFIGSPKAQLLRLKATGLFSRVRFSVVSHDLKFGRHNLSFLNRFSSSAPPPVPSSGTAMIAFTSGATGTPKGVIFTDGMIEAQLKIFSEVFGLKGGRKDLPLLGIFSLFSVSLGIGSVFPPLDPAKPIELDPALITKIINDLGISYSFGSPTLWGKISEYCLREGEKLHPIQTILMAGAPVPVEVISRVQQILPQGAAYTPYGATEALPVTTISAKALLDQKRESAISGEIGTLVGKPVPGVRIRIIRSINEGIGTIRDAQDLPALSIGEIIVSGKNVSQAYLNRPDANRIGKISDGDSFWHRMGDVGYLGSDGSLYFCGRKSHIVESSDKTYYSVPTERVFNQHPRVRRSALVGLGTPPTPGIVVEPLPQSSPLSDSDVSAFVEELKALGATDPLTSPITRFFFHPSFPVDGRHNAKIFREKLSAWATTLGHGRCRE